MAGLTVDLDLVAKYNVPGPRYTSYPTALRFNEGVGVADLVEQARGRNASRPLSLYFHLPFCRSLCWYCGCTTVITRDHSRSSAYVDALIREMDLLLGELDLGDRPVVQLHFGGGTPTFLPPSELRRLGQAIRERFRFSQDVEAGVEIDPRGLTREHVDALRAGGFNRASIGVQGVNSEVQAAVNRYQTPEQTTRALGWLRAAGFSSINIDLIYGLPKQTLASFAETLEAVLAWQPDRLAVYSYAHVPWMKPAQRLLDAAGLPEPELKLRLLKQAVETLTTSGYDYIGMDHFAREDDALARARQDGSLQRNFQGYSTRGEADLHGFGMSAISQLEGLYVQNARELPAYYSALENGRLPIARGYALGEDDRLRRRVIHHLLCHRQLGFEAMSARLGIPFRAYFAEALETLRPMAEDGLVVINGSSLQVTGTGRLFLRNLAMAFDAYLGREPSRPRYSKTV